MSKDAFEASEMHDGAPIVHRDKRVSRRSAAMIAAPGVLTLVLAVFVAIMNGSSARPVPPGMLPFVLGGLALWSVLMFVMALVFAVLRTVVTEEAVHVKYGLWGPTIPLDAITRCSVVAYDWTEFGGWGLRHGRNGDRAYVPSRGPVIEILYDEGGASRRVLVGVADAAFTAAEINRAREARAGRHLRVAVEETPVASTAEAEELEEEGAMPSAGAQKRAH